VLFANLEEAGPMVALSAVTPPGQNELSYDESYCARLGPHVHGKRYGCRIDKEALRTWSSDISKRWKRLHNAARIATKRESILPRSLKADTGGFYVREWVPAR